MEGAIVPLGQALEPRIATLVYPHKVKRAGWQIRRQGTQMTADGIVRLFVPSVRGLDLLALVGWCRAQISRSAIRQKDHHRRMRESAAASCCFAHLGLDLSTSNRPIAIARGTSPNDALPKQLEAVAKVRPQSRWIGRLGLGEEDQAVFGGAIAKDPLGIVIPQYEREVNPLLVGLQLHEVGGGGKYRIVAGHRRHQGICSTATFSNGNVLAVHGTAPVDAKVDMGEGLVDAAGGEFRLLQFLGGATIFSTAAAAAASRSFERGNGRHLERAGRGWIEQGGAKSSQEGRRSGGCFQLFFKIYLVFTIYDPIFRGEIRK